MLENVALNTQFEASELYAVSATVAPIQTEAMIVVPCYNEADRLMPWAFLDYLKENRHIQFLFVNDGSTDDTIAMLLRMQTMNPVQVHVLDLEKNGGKAEAVRQGLQKASQSSAQFIGYWDADLATPLNAIEDFLRVTRRLPDIDVIFGARKVLLGHKISRKFSRRVVSKSCATLARFAVKMPITDTQCGAKMFKNNEVIAQAVSTKFKAGWLFDVELFSRLTRLGQNQHNTFFEFPLLEWTEIPGSKVDLKAIIRSGLVMLKLIAELRFTRQKAHCCA